MRYLLLAPILMLSMAATDRDAAAVDKALAGKVAGVPKDCLSRTESASMSTHDNVLLFRVNRNLVYRNDLTNCPLRSDDIIQTNLYGTDRLCRGDIFQIVDRGSGFNRGSCTYGDFVPYTAPAR